MKLKFDDKIDVEEIAPFLKQAWKGDYKEKEFVTDHDAQYLQWLNKAPLFSVTARIDGEIAGFTQGGLRTLFVNGEPLNILYTSLLTVSPNHRRKGVAGSMSKFLLEKSEIPFQFSVYHHKHAGLPTLVRSTGKLQSVAIALVSQAAVYSKRLESASCPSLEFLARPMSVNDIENFNARIPNESRLAMSLPELYTINESGGGALTIEGGATILYCICRGRDYKVLQIHGVQDSGIGEDIIIKNILQLGIENSCDIVIYFDQGMLEKSTLISAGFVNTGETMISSLRGEPSYIDKLEPITGPTFVDFI